MHETRLGLQKRVRFIIKTIQAANSIFGCGTFLNRENAKERKREKRTTALDPFSVFFAFSHFRAFAIQKVPRDDSSHSSSAEFFAPFRQSCSSHSARER